MADISGEINAELTKIVMQIIQWHCFDLVLISFKVRKWYHRKDLQKGPRHKCRSVIDRWSSWLL